MTFTQLQIDEFVICRNDPIYFIEKYVKVYCPDGLVSVQLSGAQKDIIRRMELDRMVAEIMERQTGKTTVALAYIAWFITFHSYKVVAIVAFKASFAKDILRKLREIIDMLPDYMRPGYVRNNVTTIELENGCQVFSTGVDSSALKGRAVSLLYLDEPEFFPKRAKQEFLNSVLPTVLSGRYGKLLSLSSPDFAT